VSDEPEVKKCFFCDTTENVMTCVDPFGYELYDDEEEYDMCDSCNDDRAMDV